MMRDLYHHEQLYAREMQERVASAASHHQLSPSPISRRLARWFGLRLIRFGAYLLRYAADRRSRHLTYAR
ncbi:hypothetical protein [Chloroflexus sp.]|uniref:hypothetical protein n=1 Tax=Chloroflexus sp. TaxID=1904827 RepID=UPI002ADDE6C2|nr:hypothetical protein [Chloroflexus sp.]